MMRYHQLSADDLSALASGLGGASAVRELNASRLSRHLLLLKFVADNWPAERQELQTAIATLAEAQLRAPDLFAELMSDPMIGSWLAHTTRQLRKPKPNAVPLMGDLFHLGAVAASAAIRLDLQCDVTGYVRRGRFALPGLGAAMLGGDVEGPVNVTVTDGRATLVGAFGKATVPAEDGWTASRWLIARHDGIACSVRVEDIDPYRDRYHASPSERLAGDQADRWQSLFTDAWELICRYAPERATELAVGLRVLVPLRDEGDGAARSATANDSIGALGLTRPSSAADFAVTIIHEFQHSKLTAIGNLLRLHDDCGQERHFAPWRVDARPTGGLIQGVYAFLGVASTWHAFRDVPEINNLATTQFAIVREQVRVGLEALEASSELHAAGRQFVAGMRATLDRLLAEPLSDDALDTAQAALRARRAAWGRRER